MQISELIERLNDIKELEGDIDVAYYVEGCSYNFVNEIDLERFSNEENIVILG